MTPAEIPAFQALKTDKIVPIILVKTTLLKYDKPYSKIIGPYSAEFKVDFKIAPFAWGDELYENKWIDSYGDGFNSITVERFSEKDENIVSVSTINGNVILRPCDKCGKPVVIGYEINGVRSILFSESEILYGFCDNQANHDSPTRASTKSPMQRIIHDKPGIEHGENSKSKPNSAIPGDKK